MMPMVLDLLEHGIIYQWDTAHFITQLAQSTDPSLTYTRGKYTNEGAWSNWSLLYNSYNKPTPADIGAATADHSHIVMLPNGTNPNTVLETGFYRCVEWSYQLRKDLPVLTGDSQAMLVVYNYTTGWCRQIMMSPHDNWIYWIRACVNQAWTAWLKIDLNTLPLQRLKLSDVDKSGFTATDFVSNMNTILKKIPYEGTLFDQVTPNTVLARSIGQKLLNDGVISSLSITTFGCVLDIKKPFGAVVPIKLYTTDKNEYTTMAVYANNTYTFGPIRCTYSFT